MDGSPSPIPKLAGMMGECALGMPTMKDRAMQALYLLALDPIAETTGDPNSYGFRPERSTADAMEQCHKVLSHPTSAQWILEGDIKACFDRISHEWLLQHIPMDKSMLQKWLKAGYLEKSILYPTEEGTPQGRICSPVLANLTLDGLERRLATIHRKGTAKGKKGKVNFIRYADDFLITGSSKAFLEEEIKPLVETFMKERGLQLSEEKTVITHIEEGFDFLGQTVRKHKTGNRSKLLITPSRKNVQAFLEKVRATIKKNQSATAGNLIQQLNPMIRGWAMYHRHVVSKATFSKVDHLIYQSLWRWAKRRHPKKPRQWIQRKYFRTVGANNWVFSGEVLVSQGETRQARLFHAVSVPIRRQHKIKGEANPYDPEWEEYFEERIGVKMAHNLQGRRKLRHLWEQQQGNCPVCHQKITMLTGWHNHHIVWRSKGGPDHQENRVLLHPNCHRQVHSQGLNVMKPRPSTGV